VERRLSNVGTGTYIAEADELKNPIQTRQQKFFWIIQNNFYKSHFIKLVA